MATLQLDITDGFRPSNANVWWEPYSAKDAGAILDPLVLTYSNSSTKDGANNSFVVPQNYVGTAQLIVLWNVNATTGDAIFDLSYLNRTDAEDMGAAAQSTTDTVTLTTDGTAFNLNTSTMTLTASDFVAGDISMVELFRDTANASDTLAADLMVHKIIFQYADA